MDTCRLRRGMTRLDLVIWVAMVAACSAMIIWSWVRFAPDAKGPSSGLEGSAGEEESPAIHVESPRILLTDQAGEAFDSRSLLGKVWAIDFIFTNCAGPCPIMTGNLSSLQKAIGPNEEVHLVSITCDPWRDDPATLKRYAESYGADLNQWSFLTGAFPEIQSYARALLLTAENPREVAEGLANQQNDPVQTGEQAQSHEGPIVHSSRIVLIDRQGQVHDWYFGTESDDMQRLLADVRTLAAAPAEREVDDSGVATLLSALPKVNASLNGIAGGLLLTGFVLIRRGRRAAHMRVMIGAFLVSVVFLVSYIAYHTLRQMEHGAGHTPWEVDGFIRWVYYGILVSHVVLAAAVPFLAIRTLWLAASARFEAHRRLARVTWPIWMYVSVTGVLVYLMLYVLQPALIAS